MLIKIVTIWIGIQLTYTSIRLEWLITLFCLLSNNGFKELMQVKNIVGLIMTQVFNVHIISSIKCFVEKL